MADVENGKCHAEKAPLDSPPLIQNGKVVFQWHHIGWIVCSALTLVAMGVSFWLINKHLRWYTNKYEQRYIVRILFMVPLYALISTASYFWWNHATPLLLLRDCYESTVLTAFFYLLLLYLSPDPNEQKEIFRKNGLSKENDKERRRRGEPEQKWMFPLGFVRAKPADGLYFLQLMKWGVLQYCVVRPGTTLAAVILDYAGLYCEDSWSLGWGHVYITIVVSISVSVAMYCLIQIYMAVKVELAPQKPLLKLFAIKAVVFLTFWQATFLSILTLFGIVKDTPYMTANNINIGIGAVAETFEMAIFACLHIKAFSYKPYVNDVGPTHRWRALVHAMNFKETGREIWDGTVYMLRKYRGREVDTQARREAALENVFGRSRFAIYREANASSDVQATKSEKDLSVTVQVEKEVRVGNERQWLGAGDDYVYGLGYQAKRQRERSEGLESQIEKELARRGYSLRGTGSGGVYAPVIDAETAYISGHQRPQRSWWRRVYNRLSQSGPDADVEGTTMPPGNYPSGRHRSSSRRRSRDVTGKVGTTPLMADVQEDDYNDPPPPSAIRTYRESRNKRGRGTRSPKRKEPPTLEGPLLFTSFGDIPSPLSSPDARNDSRMMVRPPRGQDHSVLPPPALLSPPLLSPSVQSTQGDSFLDRAFAASVEPGSSVEALTTQASSSQSHHNHVKLASVPVLETRMKNQPKAPVVVNSDLVSSHTASQVPSAPLATPSPSIAPYPVPVHRTHPAAVPASSSPPMSLPQRSVPPQRSPEEDRGRKRSSHRRDSAHFYPEPRNFSPPEYPLTALPPLHQSPPQSPSQSPRLQRTTQAYSRGTRRNSGNPQHPSPTQSQYTSPYSPVNRYTPTRDRIVLPAPLAPTSSGSVTGPPREAVSTSQNTSLSASPPLEERRYTPTYAPQSPPYPNVPR